MANILNYVFTQMIHKKRPELPFTTIPALTNLLSLGEQKIIESQFLCEPSHLPYSW